MSIWIPGGYKEPGPYVPCEWGSGTDAEIVEALQKHYAGQVNLHDYWSVGDERTVHLSAIAAQGSTASDLTDTHVAQDIVFVLSEVGGKYLSDGTTECCFQVDQKDSLKETGALHPGNANTAGWYGCKRRTWCNNSYYNAIPSTLRPIFKQFINISGRPSYDPLETTDYFAYRAEIEVLNSCNYSVSGEGSWIEYYKTQANRCKKVNGSNSVWWTRSIKSGSTYDFCSINYNGSSSSYNNAPQFYGIAPFGVI